MSQKNAPKDDDFNQQRFKTYFADLSYYQRAALFILIGIICMPIGSQYGISQKQVLTSLIELLTCIDVFHRFMNK